MYGVLNNLLTFFLHFPAVFIPLPLNNGYEEGKEAHWIHLYYFDDT